MVWGNQGCYVPAAPGVGRTLPSMLCRVPGVHRALARAAGQIRVGLEIWVSSSSLPPTLHRVTWG